MQTFREWFNEKELKFKFLPKLKVNNKEVIWNENKSESLFLSQLNDRIKLQHITDSSVLGNILEKGLNIKYNEFAIGKGRDNDTCIYFRKSQFVVIFNKDEHSIIGIRNPLNNLRCNKTKLVLETYEDEEKFFKVNLNVQGFSLDEPEDGIMVTIDESNRLIVQNICKICLEVEL